MKHEFDKLLKFEPDHFHFSTLRGFSFYDLIKKD